jgi:uncharacterized protein YkwD
MYDSAPRSAAKTRRRGPRVLILAVSLGLLAPLVSAAGSAEAVTVKPRTSTEASIAKSVLSLINTERRAHHLHTVTMGKKVQASARRHNAAMAASNTMAHQVRGEASLSRRVSAVGYNWSSVGENIAWNSKLTRSGVLTLQKLMYNERAPYDGHRRNILNGAFRDVGVDVYVDTKHHKIWLTTDFGRKR